MSNINYAFLEAFKCLEKLCSEIYDEHNGVTCYIDDMMSYSHYDTSSVSGWDKDLRTLKNLRHIRNQLSHEVGTFNTEMCTYEDIEWLKDFRARILNQTDPISMLYTKRSQPYPEVTQPQKTNDNSNIFRDSSTPQSQQLSSSSVLPAILFIVCIIIIIFLVLYMNH